MKLLYRQQGCPNNGAAGEIVCVGLSREKTQSLLDCWSHLPKHSENAKVWVGAKNLRKESFFQQKNYDPKNINGVHLLCLFCFLHPIQRYFGNYMTNSEPSPEFLTYQASKGILHFVLPTRRWRVKVKQKLWKRSTNDYSSLRHAVRRSPP